MGSHACQVCVHTFLPFPPSEADVQARLDSFSFQATHTGLSHHGFYLIQIVSSPHHLPSLSHPLWPSSQHSLWHVLWTKLFTRSRWGGCGV